MTKQAVDRALDLADETIIDFRSNLWPMDNDLMINLYGNRQKLYKNGKNSEERIFHNQLGRLMCLELYGVNTVEAQPSDNMAGPGELAKYATLRADLGEHSALVRGRGTRCVLTEDEESRLNQILFQWITSTDFILDIITLECPLENPEGIEILIEMYQNAYILFQYLDMAQPRSTSTGGDMQSGFSQWFRELGRTLAAAYWIHWRWYNGSSCQRRNLAISAELSSTFAYIATSRPSLRGGLHDEGDSENQLHTELGDLDRAIAFGMELVTTGSDRESERQQCIDMTTISLFLLARYQKTHSIEDLDGALTWGKVGLELSNATLQVDTDPDGIEVGLVQDITHQDTLRDLWSRYRLAMMFGRKMEYCLATGSEYSGEFEEGRELAQRAYEQSKILAHLVSPKQQKKLQRCCASLECYRFPSNQSTNDMMAPNKDPCKEWTFNVTEASPVPVFGVDIEYRDICSNLDILITYFEEMLAKGDNPVKLTSVIACGVSKFYQMRAEHHMRHLKSGGCGHAHTHSSIEGQLRESELLTHFEREIRESQILSQEHRFDLQGKVFQERFRLHGNGCFTNPDDRDALIALYEADPELKSILDICNNQGRAPLLRIIAGWYRERFKEGGQVADIECAIAVAAECVCIYEETDEWEEKDVETAYGLLEFLTILLTAAFSDRVDESMQEWCNAQATDVLAMMRSHSGRLKSQTVQVSFERSLLACLTDGDVSITPEWLLESINRLAYFLWKDLLFDIEPSIGELIPLGVSESVGFDALKQALERLPSTGTLKLEELALRRKRDWLGKLAAIYSKATSMGLTIGKKVSESVRLLELSRTPILGNVIDYRSRQGDLEIVAPELAAEWRRLMMEFDRSYTEGLGGQSIYGAREESNTDAAPDHGASSRMHFTRQYEHLVGTIRTIEGFQGFLKPLPEDMFAPWAKDAAKDGPIVVVNVSEVGQHAILITSKGFKAIPLEFSFSEAVVQMQSLDISLETLDPAEASQIMFSVLRWLWEKIVSVVLRDLRIIGPKKAKGKKTEEGVCKSRMTSAEDCHTNTYERLPQVVWMSCGALARAPFHSAGIYPSDRAKAQYAAMYCISSYTATIKSLVYSRGHVDSQFASSPDIKDSGNAITNVPKDKVMVITMPTTPPINPNSPKDLSDLNVKVEAAQLQSLVENVGLECMALESPRSQDVLDHLPSFNIVHFACHGKAHPVEPLCSCLVLQKPSAGPGSVLVQDELTVRDIIRVRPPERVNPGGSRSLAYLSACSSACDLCTDTVHESLHIASTMQLAGFNNVIGTLWDSYDWICSEVACKFYDFLFSQNIDPAEALHLAVESVRCQENYWGMPRAWAGFICWGGGAGGGAQRKQRQKTNKTD